MASDIGIPRRWHHDPLIWLGVVVAVSSSAWVFFAGRYLPYYDWAGHVGLSAVLAHGDVSGADAYLSRSIIPTPYLSFYLSTALMSVVTTVEVAAKLNLLLTAALLVIGAARLAEATGRNPRLALIAPLSMFGASLGHGFSSYIFAVPWMLFVLADLEWLLRSMRLEDPIYEREAKVRSTFLSIGIALCFLGHGLVFLWTTWLVGLRLAVHLAPRLRDQRAAARAVMSVALAYIPTLLLSIPSVFRRIDHPYVAPEFPDDVGPGYVPLSRHLDSLWSDVLDRGGEGHELTGLLAAAVLASWVAAWLWRRSERLPKIGSVGPAIYFVASVLLFAVSPAHTGWPVTFWIVYQRAASLMVLFLFLIPACNLSDKRGAALASLAFVPLLHNAAVNAELVQAFSEQVAPYDQVRAAIPPRQRVLPIADPAGFGRFPNAANNLGFYLLADGAAYVPIGHIPEEMPVHRLEGSKTPRPLDLRTFDPDIAAEDYDFVVLYSARLRARTEGHPRFEEVTRAGGWVVFRNLDPPPRPQEAAVPD